MHGVEISVGEDKSMINRMIKVFPGGLDILNGWRVVAILIGYKRGSIFLIVKYFRLQ